MKQINRKADRELNVDEAPYSKWIAAQDATRRNRENQRIWSAMDRARVEQLAVAVSSVYAARVFTNLRKNFMVVKVENPRTVDRNSSAAIALDRRARSEDIEIIRTRTALLYRMS